MELDAVIATVEELVQVKERLEVQHEYIYETLEIEKEREQLEKRFAELEERITTNPHPLFDRLFGEDDR